MSRNGKGWARQARRGFSSSSLHLRFPRELYDILPPLFSDRIRRQLEQAKESRIIQLYKKSTIIGCFCTKCRSAKDCIQMHARFRHLEKQSKLSVNCVEQRRSNEEREMHFCHTPTLPLINDFRHFQYAIHPPPPQLTFPNFSETRLPRYTLPIESNSF